MAQTCFEEDASKKALSFKVKGQRKRGRPWKTQRKHVEGKIRGIGLQEGRHP